MQVYQCDRCKACFPVRDRKDYQIYRDQVILMDLCNNCYKSFINWLEVKNDIPKTKTKSEKKSSDNS